MLTLWTEGEGNIERRVIASGGRTRRGRENPCTSGNSPHENRETSPASVSSNGRAVGESQKPYGPHARGRGAGQRGSTEETTEQRRQAPAGAPEAEDVEGSALAEENGAQPNADEPQPKGGDRGRWRMRRVEAETACSRARL